MDAEVPDLAQEVFARAFAALPEMRDAASLGGWIASSRSSLRASAYGVVREGAGCVFYSFDELPETEAHVPAPEITEALRQTYAILDELSADERIALALRIIDGMNVTEVAEACQVSLSTIKRRLGRAGGEIPRAGSAKTGAFGVAPRRSTDGGTNELARSFG